MAFKRVIIQRVGPLSWLLGALEHFMSARNPSLKSRIAWVIGLSLLLCISLCVVYVYTIINWNKDPENCYKTDGISDSPIPPILFSPPIKTNAVRITKLDRTGELLRFLRDDEVILLALTRGGFEWVEVRYENNGEWDHLIEIPYFSNRTQKPKVEFDKIIGSSAVIKYSLRNRPDKACESFDHYVEKWASVTGLPVSKLGNRCIVAEPVLPSAPYEITLNTEKRQVKQSFTASIAGNTYYHYWRRIQIRDTRTNRTIANHYEADFGSGGGMGGGGGTVWGCYNNSAKYRVLALTLFSETGHPFIELEPKEQKYYKVGYSTGH